MLYYTNKARQSHIEKITELIEVVNETPCNLLGGFGNADAITKYLIAYREQIEKELKQYS